MDDLIKREDAIKVIKESECLGFVECKTTGLIKDINTIPSADRPQLDKDIVEPIANGNVLMSEDTYEELLADRPQGEWKNYKDEHYCSHCGEVVISDWYTEDEWYDYCPNCGASMKGADDDSKRD